MTNNRIKKKQSKAICELCRFSLSIHSEKPSKAKGCCYLFVKNGPFSGHNCVGHVGNAIKIG